jgi:hypothetical protein
MTEYSTLDYAALLRQTGGGAAHSVWTTCMPPAKLAGTIGRTQY